MDSLYSTLSDHDLNLTTSGRYIIFQRGADPDNIMRTLEIPEISVVTSNAFNPSTLLAKKWINEDDFISPECPENYPFAFNQVCISFM